MATNTIEARVLPVHDTASGWTASDLVLGVGEWGYETDTGKAKIGDGSTAWTSLEYAASTKQLCKAWVNFDGTSGSGVGSSDITIRDSYNVTSVTDLGIGQYRITFTNAMNDANYSAVGSKKDAVTVLDGHLNIYAVTSGYLDVRAIENATEADSAIVTIQVFGS